MENDKKTDTQKAPPYVSYATFSNALASLVEHGVPPQIDRSVLKQFSGVNQSLLFTAFRFMGLINEKDEPTNKLHEYEKADPEKRKTILAQILKERYPEQVKILHNGTPQMLRNSLDNVSVEASVKKKCITFFLQMAKGAGLQVSTHILQGARTRGPRKDTGKKPHIKKEKESRGAISESEEESEPKGRVRVPIAVGIGKTWAVIVDENYTNEDVERFVQIVQITLGDGKKK